MTSQRQQIKDSSGFWLRGIDISDGTITIPEAYRRAHDVDSGDIVEVFIEIDQAIGSDIVYQRYREVWSDGYRVGIPNDDLEDIKDGHSPRRLEEADVYVVKRSDSGESTSNLLHS